MAVTPDHTHELMQVAGISIQVLKGGGGEPLLMLHGAGGNPGWLAYHRELAKHFTVYAPSHPGYGQSSRPEWISTMHDMAHFYRQFIEAIGVAPVRLLGFSMGGWLAAEVAAMCPPYVRSLVLVDAAGIKPEVGEIAEIIQRLNPGYLHIYGNEGPMAHQDVTRSIELLGREVIPALHELKLQPYE